MTMALVGAGKCISPRDRDANLNILLSHVYSAALSPTLHQIRNRQQPALCWMTLMSRKNSVHFLKKMYSHSFHGPACYILFLRKPNPGVGGAGKGITVQISWKNMAIGLSHPLQSLSNGTADGWGSLPEFLPEV